MKLRRRAFGLTLGLSLGGVMSMEMIWALVEGRGSALENLSWYSPGIPVSLGGAFIGFGWGVVYGFIFGWLFAWLYNTLCKELYKSWPL